jgi:uncharacterized SAM-binding protein YcdF (DUF218 family)
VGRPGLLIRRGAATLAVMLVAGFAAFASSTRDHSAADVRDADAIVVLTGGDHRVSEGLRLLAEGRGRRLLISGVNRNTSREDLRRRTSLSGLLFECCVDIGHEALDTAGNADETQAWRRIWGFQRIIVVTSRYHMPRSLMEFARVMPHATFIPHAVARGQASETWPDPELRLILSEYVKTIPASLRFAVSRLMAPVTSEIAAPLDQRLSSRRPG